MFELAQTEYSTADALLLVQSDNQDSLLSVVSIGCTSPKTLDATE